MASFAGNTGVQERKRGITVPRPRYFQLHIAGMTVQASGGHRQIERRRDAVLKPRPHIIAAMGGVPINGRLKPVVFSAAEISPPAVSRANVVFKEPLAVEATDFKFSRAVILEPHLPVLQGNAILHCGSLMTKGRGRDVFRGRPASI